MADRAYCPWPDMEAEMRKRGVPARSRTSRGRRSGAFDVARVLAPVRADLHECAHHARSGAASRSMRRSPGRRSARDRRRPVHGESRADAPTSSTPFLIGDGEEAVSTIRGGASLATARDRPRPPPAPARHDPRRLRAGVLRGVAITPTGRSPDSAARSRTSRAREAGLHHGSLERLPFPTDSPVPLAEVVQDRLRGRGGARLHARVAASARPATGIGRSASARPTR